MPYIEQWIALVARIKGLQSAGQLYAQFKLSNNSDSFGTGRYLLRQCSDIVTELENFSRIFKNSLSPEAKACLELFINSDQVKAAKQSDGDSRNTTAALVALITFESQFSFILSDREEHIRVRSERAFMLLKRMILVDDDVKNKWMKAFNDGETSCEKHGSIHLLSQGIYAFKIDSSGARTDLVFSEPPDELLLARSVDGLVLTEWKKIANPKELNSKLEAAFEQARSYAAGPLAGLELRGFRYLVAVSNKEVSMPDDFSFEDITYRYINIVVDPDTPSKAAQKASRNAK